MARVQVFLSVLIIIILSIGISWAEIYKWVDEKGVLHFSDTPPQNISESPGKEDLSTDDENLQDTLHQNSETQDVKIDFELLDTPMESEQESEYPHLATVELYVTSWCRYCKKARDFFLSRGVTFVEYDVEKDPGAARRMMKLTSRRSIPFVVINGQQFHGFNEAVYERALCD